MPSVVVTEKCAISDGVNANRANATFAALSENNLREANHSVVPSNDAEQRVHRARVPGQPLRARLHRGHAIAAQQLLLRNLDVRACYRRA